MFAEVIFGGVLTGNAKTINNPLSNITTTNYTKGKPAVCAIHRFYE
jgi:hypothetical protein